MPISEAEWASVQAMVEKKVAEKGEAFTTSVVIKRDPDRRVIWTRDFGDEPIPVVAFNNYVRTFDTMGSQVIVRDLSANVIVPQVGDTVLIARELGTRRLPRCLGVINGAGITSGDPATNGSGPSPDNRLGPKTALITDWNSAAETGWYRCGPGAANSPSGGDGFWIGEIVSHRPFSEPGIGDPWITQEAWAFTENQPQARWRRVCLNGAWSSWARVVPPDSTKVAIKRPGVAGNSAVFTIQTEIFGAVANDLRHAITPSVNLWWEVECWTIVSIVDNIWMSCDLAINLDPGPTIQDAAGQVESSHSRVVAHPATSWVGIRNTGLFKLAAGSSYSIRPLLIPGGYSWNYYHQYGFTGSSSKVVGYW